MQEYFSLAQSDFHSLALNVFRFQASHNPVYRQFLQQINCTPAAIENIHDIPFLPISLFKTQKILTYYQQAETIFTSSGTAQQNAFSQHHVARMEMYEQSFRQTFSLFYDTPENYHILALLPAYLEREGSSLVYMADALIRQSKGAYSGFYLYDYESLAEKIIKAEVSGQKTLLIGVSFALLDFVEKYPHFPLKNTIIMETGGMKGKRPELTRPELHGILSAAFAVEKIHSEYGMTELLSQAYSQGEGIFACPPWMRVLCGDAYDPRAWVASGQNGVLRIIDLANLYSCSFIATQDVGKVFPDGTFEILGRTDNSDLRGCNLLVEA
ncbi:MAG: acyl transferase [Bacteroidetes bacterium]|nr:acyl transferase [Bacteroidota bacterium]MCB9042820.1 acyl transferase [Chitinophagales bacterium]